MSPAPEKSERSPVLDENAMHLLRRCVQPSEDKGLRQAMVSSFHGRELASLRAVRSLPIVTAVALGSMIGLPLTTRVVLAAQPNGTTPRNASPEAIVSFNIPAQPLSAALTQLGQQANIQVTFDSALTNNLMASSLVGKYTVRAALDRMLANTGRTYSFLNSGTVTLQIAGSTSGMTLPPVLVGGQGNTETAYGPGDGYVAHQTVTGSKTDTPVIDIPQSISVVTRQQMDDQNPEEVSQALRYTPGIFPEGFGAASNFNTSSNLVVRAFPADSYIDDLKDPLTSTIPPYFLDRVELLGGPASVLYGQASPGGIVNITSKLPTETPIHEIELGTGNFGRAYSAFDLGGPIGSSGQFSYRLTGMALSEDTQTNFVRRQTIAIAPALTWRPDDNTTLTILGKYINNPALGATDAVPAQGTVLPNPNGKIPSSFYTGDPNEFHNSEILASVGYEFQHRFNDMWTVRQNFRYENVAEKFAYLGNEGLATDLATLDRGSLVSNTSSYAITVDTQAQAKFHTGPLDHTLLMGVDYQREYSKDNFDFDFEGIPSINIFSPVYFQSIPTDVTENFSSARSQLSQVGPYAQDQVSLGRWRFLAGGREDFASNTSGSSASSTTQSAQKFTWRAGLVYLFDNGVAPYASYSTSFKPDIGTTFLGSAFSPTTGQQYEAGIKYQPPGSNSFVTAAVYNLTEQNVLTPDPDPTHAGFDVQTGEIRARGIELQAHSNLTDNLSLIASYTYTDATNTKSNATDTTINGVTESTKGKRPIGVPDQMASLWGEYSIHSGRANGLGFGAGVRYVGASYGDDVNSFKVPSFALFDAELHYDLGHFSPSLKGARLQANASNIFDKSYVASCQNEVGCYFGLRRTVYANIKYDW